MSSPQGRPRRGRPFRCDVGDAEAEPVCKKLGMCVGPVSNGRRQVASRPRREASATCPSRDGATHAPRCTHYGAGSWVSTPLTRPSTRYIITTIIRALAGTCVRRTVSTLRIASAEGVATGVCGVASYHACQLLPTNHSASDRRSRSAGGAPLPWHLRCIDSNLARQEREDGAYSP